MKLISVVFLLAGLACSTAVSNDDEEHALLAGPRRRGYRRQRRSCGKVALLRQDCKDKTTRCLGHLERKIKQHFNVEVADDLERVEDHDPLLKVLVDKDTRCGELTKEVLGDIKSEIKKKYNGRRTRACIRKPVPGYLRTRASSTSTKGSKASTTSRSKRSRKTCGAPVYIDSGFPDCDQVTKGAHVNSYYENPNFLCKTDQRPCDTPCALLDMELPNGMVLNLRAGPGGTVCVGRNFSGGPAELWQVRTDRDGVPKKFPWNSEYRFLAEGECVNQSRALGSDDVGLADLNNVGFDSLECIEPWDEDDMIFLIVDGTLVDSCPKRIAQQCRDCDGR